MDIEFFVSKSHRYSQARRFSRIPADFPVHLASAELRVNDRVNDISEAGIGVLTARPLPAMTLITMRLDLPHGAEPVEITGRVMWAGEHKMGIRFEHPDPRVTDVVVKIRQDYERI